MTYTRWAFCALGCYAGMVLSVAWGFGLVGLFCFLGFLGSGIGILYVERIRNEND